MQVVNWVGPSITTTGFCGNGFQNNNGPTRNDRAWCWCVRWLRLTRTSVSEMGYDWLGRMAYKGSVDNGAFKAQGVQLTAKLGYPITDDLDISHPSGRHGLALTQRQLRFYRRFRSEHDTGVSQYLLGGVEWAVTRDIATRLEYQWVNNIGDAGTVGTRPDNGMLSLGVSSRFGQEDAAPVVAPAPAPAPEVATKHFTLKSDVLFNFQQSYPETGRSAGSGSAVHSAEQTHGSERRFRAVVLGYTDRIGSEAYNQAAVWRHAQSVVDYLVC